MSYKLFIVIGAGGYLGRYFIETNKKDKKNLYFLIFKNKNFQKINNKNFIYFYGNILNIQNQIKDKIRSLKIKNKEIVLLHLASLTDIEKCEKNKRLARQTNINLTKNILKFSKKIKIDKYFYFSTVQIYKPAKKIITESSEALPNSYYGKTKLISENLVKKFCSENKIYFYILRLSNIISKYPKENTLLFSIFRNLKPSKKIFNIENPEAKRDFISIEYLFYIVNFLIKLKKKNKSGIFNISSGKNYSVAQIVEYIRKKRKLNYKKIMYNYKSIKNVSFNISNKKILKLGIKKQFDTLNYLNKIL